jgi:hypothetical protein
MRALGKYVPVFLCVLALILSVPVPSAEAHPVRVAIGGLSGLFVTTAGETFEAGTMVIGAGFLFGDEGDVGYDTYTIPVTFTYAFTDDVEGGVSVPVRSSVDFDGGGSTSGLGDVLLSVKYSLQKETETMPSVAVGGKLKLGTADDGLGTEKTDVGIFMAADKALGKVNGYVNVELLITGGDAPEDQANYAFGLEFPYTDTTTFALELLDQGFGFFGGTLTSTYMGGDLLLGGVSIDIEPSMNLGFALGVGLNDSSTDTVVGGKFAFKF